MSKKNEQKKSNNKNMMNEKINWQQVYVNAAIAAMQGFCSNAELTAWSEREVADAAESQARALLTKLKFNEKRGDTLVSTFSRSEK